MTVMQVRRCFIAVREKTRSVQAKVKDPGTGQVPQLRFAPSNEGGYHSNAVKRSVKPSVQSSVAKSAEVESNMPKLSTETEKPKLHDSVESKIDGTNPVAGKKTDIKIQEGGACNNLLRRPKVDDVEQCASTEKLETFEDQGMVNPELNRLLTEKERLENSWNTIRSLGIGFAVVNAVVSVLCAYRSAAIIINVMDEPRTYDASGNLIVVFVSPTIIVVLAHVW
eukprot:CAMPEP_0170173680 /NCGR_PEP_ID=MMETSP0040_2-20121228/6963_1 /TAXON_ID=641309 /ORGANISM="Lotharella oceanica, Strain CCMP622" /LENGTH=223 /DNA_ID=CAMNT_0010414985 /DNA_START=373 /DNA_END=1041 /DNA_ORIENTATION=+